MGQRRNPAIVCDHRGVCRPLEKCPRWAVDLFIQDRINEDWHAPEQGGFADGRSVRDVDADQLAKGLCVELEHTSCWFAAIRIAMDHLVEFPTYYGELDKMEKRLRAQIMRRVLR